MHCMLISIGNIFGCDYWFHLIIFGLIILECSFFIGIKYINYLGNGQIQWLMNFQWVFQWIQIIFDSIRNEIRQTIEWQCASRFLLFFIIFQSLYIRFILLYTVLAVSITNMNSLFNLSQNEIRNYTKSTCMIFMSLPIGAS